MTFTVTYRAKDGALREERVEAANRAECVAECRRRGIAPTKIAEGEPGNSGKSGNSGKLWLAISDPPPIFDNPSDNAIAMALGDASGAPLPPVPGLDDANLDEEFAKSLLKPIEISEDDKPGVAAVKMLVSEARKEIAEVKNAGDTRTVGELLQEHINMNNHAANLRGETLRQVSRVRREDGDVAAKEYLAKMNETLERFGVAPVEIDFEGEQP